MKKFFFIFISFLIILIISNKVAKQFLKQAKLEKNDFKMKKTATTREISNKLRKDTLFLTFFVSIKML